ncbi:MAG TPA: hypothetical protein VHI14_10235 [Jatrophihabitantaceae bacterium]|jgi:hypothetical protein|nr:hypothetical protein [Jatrophihabitantaceae bacterium]
MAVAAPSSYQHLDPAAVQSTVDRLVVRITRRFPDRHLGGVAAELSGLVRAVTEQSSEDRRRNRVIRIACAAGAAAIIAIAVTAMILAVREAIPESGEIRGFQWLSILESAIVDLVYGSIAVYFLMSLPNRLTRRRLLGLLHRLRSMAHVVDMHQLTKDPERLQERFHGTDVTIVFDLDAGLLNNYLEYCTEILSLISKTAALCAEESTDAVVLDTVSEVETLTIGLSRKIWQKISLLRAP